MSEKKKRVPHNKGKKEEVKHWYYTNGVVSIRIPYYQSPPDGFIRGRLKRKLTIEEKIKFNAKRKATCLANYGDENYNNNAQNAITKQERYGDPNYNNREQAKETCLTNYDCENVSQIPDVRFKISSKLMGHNSSPERNKNISNAKRGFKLSPEKQALANKRKNETMHKNGTYKRHKTKAEIDIENQLIAIFGVEHIFYQYTDLERYPFNCDFYVDTVDLFIEVHAGWRHMGIPYDENDEWCKNKLNFLLDKAKTSRNYENAIYQWTKLDPKKWAVAKENNLNFIATYPGKNYYINENLVNCWKLSLK